MECQAPSFILKPLHFTSPGETHKRNTIILIPGGPGNDCDMYDAPDKSIAKTFANIVDVILFDPRGVRNSATADVEHCSLLHYIEDIEAIRQYFNIPTDKFMVFGQSYGAIAATAYAIQYPDNLNKLLLIGGVVDSSFIDDAKQYLAEFGSVAQQQLAEKLWQGTFDGSQQEIIDFYRIMSPLYSYSFVEQENAPLAINYNVDIMNYGWGNFLKQIDFSKDLHKISCSTLILWGENEWIMNKRQVTSLHQAIRGSRLITYSQCSHMLWLDQWQRFVKDSIEFLST